MLSTNAEEYIDLLLHKQAVQLKVEDVNQKNLERLHYINQHLKNFTELNLRALPAHLCDRLINPYHKKSKYTCICGRLPYDSHWLQCEELLEKLE